MSMPQIDPSVYDDVLTYGNASAQMNPEIERQKKLAEYLRTVLGAAPQTRMSGRRASAPHWMEMMGALAAQGGAAMKDADVSQQQQTQQRFQAHQVQRVLEALKAQQAAQQGPMQMYPPVGNNIEGGQ